MRRSALPAKIAAKRQKQPTPTGGFDASIVSESLWTQWCETVNHYGLGPEKLGRLAPSLQSLPTVIWHSRLEEYADLSLAEIRSRKTHGEKRVHAILEVFCTVHEALSTATLQENIDVVLVPRFVPPITRWLMEAVGQPDLPPVDDLHQHIVKPLVHQIKIDLGDQVAGLAAARLVPRREFAERQAASRNDRRHAGPRLPIAGRLREGDGRPLARRPLALRPAGDAVRLVRPGNDRPGARHRRSVLSVERPAGTVSDEGQEELALQ